MAKGLNTPNILLASSNSMKMIQNLKHLLSAKEVGKLTAEIDRNVILLHQLGHSHVSFAATIDNKFWRQKISRLYYAVYNLRRGTMLKCSGHYSTDSSDHKTVDDIPRKLDNRDSHIVNLRNLREDRNLADYSHLAKVGDLIMQPDDAMQFAKQFCEDCDSYLLGEGVAL